MPGSPQRRARAQVEAEIRRVASAGELPTPRRTSPAEWSDDLSDEAVGLGEHGLSEAEIAAHWRISLGTLRSWALARSEFREALARAETQAIAWWETAARRAINTGDNRFPAGAWSQVMRARFPEYRERADLSVRVDVTERLVVIHRRAPEHPGDATSVIEGEMVSASSRRQVALLPEPN